MVLTVIEYYGEQKNSRCGYCKNNGSQSHGMHAYIMTPQDYQDLIDRGWRRSGRYCYKPNNKITCCPAYTIKCDCKEFKMSKSHKKIIKRMNKFLTDGVKNKKDQEQSSEQQNPDSGSKSKKNLVSAVEDQSNDDDDEIRISEEPDVPCRPIQDIQVENIKSEKREEDLELRKMESKEDGNGSEMGKSSSSITSNSESVDLSKMQKPPCKKAKQKRLERRQMKLAAKGLPLDSLKGNEKKNQQRNREKTLRELIHEVPENACHKLKVLLVPSSKGVTKDVLELYRKYQLIIHKDPPQKLTQAQFERFLVKSPLKVNMFSFFLNNSFLFSVLVMYRWVMFILKQLYDKITMPYKLKLVAVDSEEFQSTLQSSYGLYSKYQTTIHNDPPDDVDDYLNFLVRSPIKNLKTASGPPDGYGSFHQQYWLDDKLIAVGVIDILPYCISSVYFFYDPDYSFLSLGTYGSLREIDFTLQLNEKVELLKNYYMGFYIHSCPKMRYKDRLTPSYLLCPEVYTWHLLTDEIRDKLNRSKYQRLNEDPNARDSNEFTGNDINSVLLLVNQNTYLKYSEFIQYVNGDSSNIEDILEYGKLVGKSCAHKMIYATAF